MDNSPLLRTRMAIVIVCVCATAFLTAPSAVLAQWSTNPAVNNPICTTAGRQTQPAAVSDGQGGAIIVWSDQRGGPPPTPDCGIYAQRITGRGIVQWKRDGVPVCTGTDGKDSPGIVTDGAGGAIIVWEDHRSGPDYLARLFAQRISGQGSLLWAGDGVPVSAVPGQQGNCGMVSDNAGGLIVVWENSSGPSSNHVIYAQRINGDGLPQWTNQGIVLSAGTTQQGSPVIAGDGAQGYFIAWQEALGYPSTTGYKVHFTRLDGTGKSPWGSVSGQSLPMTMKYSPGPQIAPDGKSGLIITWMDSRNDASSGSRPANLDIYAEHIDPLGMLQLSEPDFPVCTAPGNQSGPLIVSAGTGGAVIAWSDGRTSGTSGVFLQRVDANGKGAWATNGIPVCPLRHSQSPSVIGDGAGGSIIAWQGSRYRDLDLFAQRLNGLGEGQWPADGVAICTAGLYQDGVTMVSDGSGGAILVWCDQRNGPYFDIHIETDIYAQAVDRYGYLGDVAPRIREVRDVPNDQGGKLEVLWEPSYLDVWPDTVIMAYQILRGVRASALSAPAEIMPLAELVARAGRGEDIRGRYGASAAREDQGSGFYWEIVATVPASRLEGYTASIDTYADSASPGNALTYFKVVARAAGPLTYWESEVDSGYSVDNLSPIAPTGLTAQSIQGTVRLGWHRSIETDLACYAIYRSSGAGFRVDTAAVYSTTNDTVWSDPDQAASAGMFYAVCAVDVHGNKSLKSNEAAVGVLGLREGAEAVPGEIALFQNYPNPFNPLTTIQFVLPARSYIRLAVYTTLGQQVAELVNGVIDPGRHSVPFDAGGLSSGVYFYRLSAAPLEPNGLVPGHASNGQAGSFVGVKKLIVQK